MASQLPGEVIRRGSIDFYWAPEHYSPSLVFPGVLRLSSFLVVTIWVTSLGSVLRREKFAEL